MTLVDLALRWREQFMRRTGRVMPANCPNASAFCERLEARSNLHLFVQLLAAGKDRALITNGTHTICDA
jgi:hypothetical protein